MIRKRIKHVREAASSVLALGLLLGLAVVGCAGSDAAEEAAGDMAEADTPAETEAPADDAMTQGPKWGDGLLNPNLADEAEISGLPGIIEGAAAAIMDGRPFMDMVALDAAISSHMDEAARETLYGAMWIPSNLNSASEAELLLIPGVGERMAYEFDEYRPYDGMERFRREIGKYVDEEVIEQYAQYVFIPIDLNTATDEQILMIPGVGSRMLREFKEYRPYTNIEQFRREMGKYVDDGEVARLARYVMIGEG
jgi:DNA uptake protein ComE-like DNA-binding protein